MSERSDEMTPGGRLAGTLDDRAVSQLAAIAEIDASAGNAAAGQFGVSCSEDVITLTFDGAGRVRVRPNKKAVMAWPLSELDHPVHTVAGLLSSRIYEVCWPHWYRHARADDVVGRLPLPPYDPGFAAQLAVVSRKRMAVVAATEATALRDALDRIVAELYELDLDLLMTYEWDL